MSEINKEPNPDAKTTKIPSFIQTLLVLLLMLNVLFVGGLLGLMGAMLMVTLLPGEVMSDRSALHFYSLAIVGGLVAAACSIPKIHRRFYG